MPDFTFKKEERLKSRKILSLLFSKGSSFSAFPLRVVWTPILRPQSDAPAQMALSVPKKKFNKAAHRNLLRRRIREAYRLNKHFLYEDIADCRHQYGFMFIYVAKETLPYEKIERAMTSILKRLSKELNKVDATISD